MRNLRRENPHFLSTPHEGLKSHFSELTACLWRYGRNLVDIPSVVAIGITRDVGCCVACLFPVVCAVVVARVVRD